MVIVKKKERESWVNKWEWIVSVLPPIFMEESTEVQSKNGGQPKVIYFQTLSPLLLGQGKFKILMFIT